MNSTIRPDDLHLEEADGSADALRRPLQISFHNLDHSEAVERQIRHHVGRLLRLSGGRLIGCRVSVEKLHRQHRTGNMYEVHVRMALRGQEAAVSGEPNRARERFSHPDIYVSLREAFRVAGRQLTDLKTRRRRQGRQYDRASRAALAAG